MGRLALLIHLVVKDWRLFLADRRAAALAFAVPVALASVFGMIFERPAARMGAVRLPLLVVVEDGDPFTRRVVADLLANEHVEAVECDRATAERRVANRECGVALILPAGFGRLTGVTINEPFERPNVELIHHPLSALEGQWAEAALTEAVMRRLVRERLTAMMPGEAVQLNRPFAVGRQAVPAEANRAFNAYSHSFCGMTVQYLLFWGMDGGLGLLRERQRGIWRRTRAAPVSLALLLLAKALSVAGVALMQVLVTFGFGHLAFGVSVTGSVAGFVGLVLAVSLLAAATGLLVAAVGGTEARARNLCIVVILAASLLGGLWLPSFLLPGWVQELGRWLPTSWAMRGLDGVTWQGMGGRDALTCAVAVAGFGLVFLAAATARLAGSEARRRRGVCQ